VSLEAANQVWAIDKWIHYLLWLIERTLWPVVVWGTAWGTLGNTQHRPLKMRDRPGAFFTQAKAAGVPGQEYSQRVWGWNLRTPCHSKQAQCADTLPRTSREGAASALSRQVKQEMLVLNPGRKFLQPQDNCCVCFGGERRYPFTRCETRQGFIARTPANKYR